MENDREIIFRLPASPADAAQVESRTLRSDSGAPVHASEGAAAAAMPAPLLTSLARLLTSHILHDGETILLILRPSPWFVLFNSVWFSSVTLFFVVGSMLLESRTEMHMRLLVETAVFLIAGRMSWAILQWMGRLYILTDMRIMRLSGVFTIEVFDCALRKVANTRMVSPPHERMLRLGSIEILPHDDWPGVWQTVARPDEVHAEIRAAINRSRQTPNLTSRDSAA